MGRELVQALVLDDSERKGYVFTMGDMNYRIDMSPEDVLSFDAESIHSRSVCS